VAPELEDDDEEPQAALELHGPQSLVAQVGQGKALHTATLAGFVAVQASSATGTPSTVVEERHSTARVAVPAAQGRSHAPNSLVHQKVAQGFVAQLPVLGGAGPATSGAAAQRSLATTTPP